MAFSRYERPYDPLVPALIINSSSLPVSQKRSSTGHSFAVAAQKYSVIQAMAPSLRVEVNPPNMLDAHEIERDVAAFARSPNAGLIITASGVSIRFRELIITLAGRYKLPAIYWASSSVASGA